MSDSGGSGASSGSARVIAVAVVAAIAGLALLVVGITAFGQASDTKDETQQLQRAQPAVVARTRQAEDQADAPIGRAEKLAATISATVEAGDTLFDTTNSAGDLFSRAVGLANGGNRAAANQLYTGEGATSVEKVNEDLARARAAVTAAQRAAADLHGTSP